jgi:hypothetical protein
VKAAVLAVTTSLIFAGAANPAADTGLAALKQTTVGRIDARTATLNTLQAAVNGAQRLAPAHKAQLTSIVSADLSGLAALKTKVSGETTAAAVRADATSMVTGYRVYLLVVPQVRLTVAADLAGAAGLQLRQVHDTLAAAVAAAKRSGKDVSKAEADLADMLTQIDAATVTGVGALLDTRPSADAGAMQAVVQPVRDSAHAARTSLRKAVADAKDARSVLTG